MTVEKQGESSPATVESGMLRDIGVGGARLYLSRPLEVGASVILNIHFPSPNQRITKIRFKGIVARSESQPQYEITVSFRGAGKFVREGLKELLEDLASVRT